MPDSAQQITSMVHRYCELFDTGQLDEFAAQFEHGQWHRAEPGAAATRRWIDEHVLLYDGLPLPGTRPRTSSWTSTRTPERRRHSRTSQCYRRYPTSPSSRSSSAVTGIASPAWVMGGAGSGARSSPTSTATPRITSGPRPRPGAYESAPTAHE